MAQSEDTFEIRDKVAVFTTYESYLDSLVGESDRAFLDDDDLARGLVALGLRGSGDVLSREEFDARKKADRDRHLHKDVLPKPLAAMGKDLTGKVLLAALAAREPLVRNGKLTVIVYIRDYNSKGQEVSGYIDLAHRCGRRAADAARGSGRRQRGTGVGVWCLRTERGVTPPADPKRALSAGTRTFVRGHDRVVL
jgi:hypothetical protein